MNENLAIFDLPDEAATLSNAACLAPCLNQLSCIYLEGDLGMGKTTWVRGLLRALGHAGAVKSPSFSLLEIYPLQKRQIAHLDCYRMADPEEVVHLGLEDYFSADTTYLIEWPKFGEPWLPPADLVLAFAAKGQGRKLTWRSQTEAGRAVLEQYDGG